MHRSFVIPSPSSVTVSERFPHCGQRVFFMEASVPIDTCPQNNWVPKNICRSLSMKALPSDVAAGSA
jgi:hypothetical protein